jgi:molybdenum cofactor cytidylyltransferase
VRDLAAILLAAGGSTRLGTPKQLLKYQGKTLIRRIADLAIACGCNPVVVVLGHQAEQMQEELSGLPVQTTLNSNWQRGIGSSIRQGVDHLLTLKPEAQAVFLLLCDQPLVTAEDLHRLTEGFETSGKPVCVCSYESTIGPPVLIAREFFTSLQALPDAQGAKAVWSGHPQFLQIIPCARAAVDIDTPDDLELLKSNIDAKV